MKNILVTLAFLTCFFFGLAQSTSVTVTCSGGGSSCFSPEPGVNTTYTYTTTNPPSGYTITEILWTPTGDSQHGTNGGESYNVTWPNSPNSSIKKLKVRIKWSKTGSSDIFATSPEVTITVKYISPISSISISGGGVSGTYTNNATVSVPCGARTMTLTAAVPTTDPSSSVVYEWLLPSGWSGSSSTNSITVTAPAG